MTVRKSPWEGFEKNGKYGWIHLATGNLVDAKTVGYLVVFADGTSVKAATADEARRLARGDVRFYVLPGSNEQPAPKKAAPLLFPKMNSLLRKKTESIRRLVNNRPLVTPGVPGRTLTFKCVRETSASCQAFAKTFDNFADFEVVARSGRKSHTCETCLTDAERRIVENHVVATVDCTPPAVTFEKLAESERAAKDE